MKEYKIKKKVAIILALGYDYSIYNLIGVLI